MTKSPVPKQLDAIAGLVLAYRPKAKSKPARSRKRTRRFWQAAKDALQAEKAVSQEHFDYYLSESGRCEVARSALARIGHGMDLRYAEPKGMAEVAREALERTTRTDLQPNRMERLARLVEEFRNAGELDKLRHGLGLGQPLGVSPLKALMDRECESLRPQVDDAHKRET